MLRSLVMTDFKVFANQRFDFPTGITALIGPNGVGKTTVLEAIEFALFRQITRKEKSIKRMEDLIRHQRKKAVVSLRFQSPINGKVYQVRREIYVNKSTAELQEVETGKIVENTVRAVDNEIIKLLGMDRNAFAALTYVRQGDIDRLSRLSPAQKRGTIHDMMGLGVYNKIAKKVQLTIRELKNEIKQAEETRRKLEEIQQHLPTFEEINHALTALKQIKEVVGENRNIEAIQIILEKMQTSQKKVLEQLSDPALLDLPKQKEKKRTLAEQLRTILTQIPEVAEEQLKPRIRDEAREIFLSIFGDRYTDLQISDDYDIHLYDVRGNRVPLAAASGGEDVCVNFSLRVAVNTALQKESFESSKLRTPGLLILDEPGAGLDSQRRRWLPEAIGSLRTVTQVIIVTHMTEIRDAADTVIELIPQGRGRQPIIRTDEREQADESIPIGR